MKFHRELTSRTVRTFVFLALTITFAAVVYTTRPLFMSPTNTLTAAVFPSAIAALTNSERLSNNVGILSVNPLLNTAAQMKANDMVNRGYYAHVSPDGKSPLYWLTAVGYKYVNVGENLVVNVSDSNQAVDAWMNSPEHRDNILRAQFTETGIGVAEGQYNGRETTYVVQLFATPYPTKPIVSKAIIPSLQSEPKATSKPAIPVITGASVPIVSILQSLRISSSTARDPALNPSSLSVSVDQNPPVEIGTVTPKSPSITNAPLVGSGEVINDSNHVPSYTPAQIEIWFSVNAANLSSDVSTLLTRTLR